MALTDTIKDVLGMGETSGCRENSIWQLCYEMCMGLTSFQLPTDKQCPMPAYQYNTETHAHIF